MTERNADMNAEFDGDFRRKSSLDLDLQITINPASNSVTCGNEGKEIFVRMYSVLIFCSSL